MSRSSDLPVPGRCSIVDADSPKQLDRTLVRISLLDKFITLSIWQTRTWQPMNGFIRRCTCGCIHAAVVRQEDLNSYPEKLITCRESTTKCTIRKCYLPTLLSLADLQKPTANGPSFQKKVDLDELYLPEFFYVQSNRFKSFSGYC
jgi:hypothetical protein